jgi:hypothetical protein
MTTATTTATPESILALDLGKYKSVACVHNAAGGEMHFQTLPTVASARKLLVRLWAMLRDRTAWRDDPKAAPA